MAKAKRRTEDELVRGGFKPARNRAQARRTAPKRTKKGGAKSGGGTR